jgi:N-acyl homoserine lactone hydrolase
VALRIGADGRPEAMEKRVLDIQAWFGASLDEVTKFDVTETGAT